MSRKTKSGGGEGLGLLILLGIVGFVTYPMFTFLLLIAVVLVWWAVKRAGRYKTMEATELAGLLANVRQMSGLQFEAFIAEVFRAMGHRAQVMGGSGDQGVDVIVSTNDDQKIAVQCKNYARAVGNKPVQEVYAGAVHHGCAQAWVVAPSGFTKGAFELAASVGVSLFDERGIRAWIGQVEAAAKAREEAASEGKKQVKQTPDQQRPRAKWLSHPDDPQPSSQNKVSMIDGRIVLDTEAYALLLNKYEGYLECLEGLLTTKLEHAEAYRTDPSVKRQWQRTKKRVRSSIDKVLTKLDTLEGRNPGFAAGELVSRRAKLASRHIDIEKGIESEDHRPNHDFTDQIRKLSELRDDGILTNEEFEAKKAEILKRA